MKKIIALALILVIAAAGIGAWVALTPAVPTIDSMRNQQADAWFTLHGWCVDNSNAASKGAAEACTDFTDSVLVRSTEAGTSIEKYMLAHPELYHAPQIPSSFRTVVAKLAERKA